MNDPKLKIVYMGSAEFAVPALDALVKAGQEIAAVVTQPDRARGRGGRIRPTPVGLYAETAGIRSLKPERLKDDEGFEKALRQAAPDLIVVAAYGKILPEFALKIPPLGCVNIHASLLPEYRGAAPVQRAILGGKSETGVTLMYVAEELDKGDMISAAKTCTGDKNAGELTEELAMLGAKLLVEMLPLLAAGTAPRIPQDDSKATYAQKIEKAEGGLRFGQAAEEIALRVRAMTPAPGAYVIKDNKRIGITAARMLGADEAEEAYEGYADEAPGTVLNVSKQGIAVRAGEGVVLIEALKIPGRKAMPVAEYLKGNAFDIKSL